VLSEPSAGIGEGAARQRAVRHTSDFGARDQSRLLQDTQVLGDTGRRYGKWLAEFTDGTRSAGQLLEDRPTCGICQRTEHGVKRID
jgi:hypothetical protein